MRSTNDRQEVGSATGPQVEGSAAREGAKSEPPATLGQKFFIVVLCLCMFSLVRLVLRHHWYGALPRWLDPHWRPTDAAALRGRRRG